MGQRTSNHWRHAATFEQALGAALSDQCAVARLLSVAQECATNAARRRRVVGEHDSRPRSPCRPCRAQRAGARERVEVQHVRAHVVENVHQRSGGGLVPFSVQIRDALALAYAEAIHRGAVVLVAVRGRTVRGCGNDAFHSVSSEVARELRHIDLRAARGVREVPERDVNDSHGLSDELARRLVRPRRTRRHRDAIDSALV